jgi:type III pantothenate kinase
VKSILAIDIGNTSVHCAVWRGGRFVRRFRIATSSLKFRAAGAFKRYARLDPPPDAVIASVVPPAGNYLRARLRKMGLRTHLIGRDLHAPIRNRYRDPKQVGVDRLMNALAAWRRMKRDLIVVDFGTAVTFDIVSRKGEYLGGVIAPGIEISLEALYRKTALLPRILLKAPRSIIGRDTIQSIRAGCSFGIGGLCSRIIKEIRLSTGRHSPVLGTGGYARFMARYCPDIRVIDPDLTLKGIVMTYRDRFPA